MRLCAFGVFGCHHSRMKFYPEVLVIAMLLWLSGVGQELHAATEPSPKIAVVTAFEGVVWMESSKGTALIEAMLTGFDPDAIAVAAAKAALIKPLEVIDGREAELLPREIPLRIIAVNKDDILKKRLVELGLKKQVDRFLVIQTAQLSGWFGRNVTLSGMGYIKGWFPVLRGQMVYGAFVLRTFDCRTQKFSKKQTDRLSQEISIEAWRPHWSDYSGGEQQRFLREWEKLVKEAIPSLLTKAGYAKSAVVGPSTTEQIFMIGQKPKSWLPEGNVLECAKDVPQDRVQQAVVDGLKDRRWTLVSQSGDKVVGFYRDGKKEAGVTAIIKDHAITLTYEAHRISGKGAREPVELYERWNNNLKESIFKRLVAAENETAGNPEPVK